MGLKDYTQEQLKEISMIDVTFELLTEHNEPEDYSVLINRVAEIQELSDERKKERISHLYTQMSLDGRFVNLGDNRWALRSWYPFEQTEEELSQTMPKRRKAAKEEAEAEGFDDELEETDEFEDIEDELDELANEEDTDFEDLDEEDFGADGEEEKEDDEDEEAEEEEEEK
ncbi:DNA-directed RNA polymerase subunit delta [Alkalicoccus urumqiensis]|uniref:Probable DNA-directed RNA polymerase subunit delta n=1 Tax=Alkalicoccus urumqiensis TaxID=1548213 RepID=A0A2P6MHL5_ALKUR|nr:DNA-directed RNA polymerase subunit delta [Alkalicoccus urumqiensis]PRO65740.1 DNA-directed RNA polymerase subunit delta [Alkalicoccus urumqiensis]